MSGKVDQSGYQLDKGELLHDVPLVAKGVAGGIIDAINKIDINHDGKADISQVAKVLLKAYPFIHALAPLIDTKKATAYFVEELSKAGAITDKAAAEAHIEQIFAVVATEAAALAAKN